MQQLGRWRRVQAAARACRSCARAGAGAHSASRALPATAHPCPPPSPPPWRSRLELKGLSGTIPPGGFLLPDTVELFALDANLVQGRLPEQLSFPAAIRNYSLAMNGITGTIPKYSLPEGLQFFNLGERRRGWQVALAGAAGWLGGGCWVAWRGLRGRAGRGWNARARRVLRTSGRCSAACVRAGSGLASSSQGAAGV